VGPQATSSRARSAASPPPPHRSRQPAAPPAGPTARSPIAALPHRGESRAL